MKIRSDFVTNSSSSSFIIATKEEVPTPYINHIKRVTKENLVDILKDTYCCPWDIISSAMSNQEFQELGNFTDEQMALILMANAYQLGTYQTLKMHLDTDETPIYHIFVDRDWLYYQNELNSFIDNAVVLDKREDL